MRHATSSRRSRNRNNNNGQRRGNQNRMQVFDSNGPDVRIRGTAHQICEKYMTLAKDAASCGDSILAESYLQHAEHYQRVINSWNAENPQAAPQATSDEDTYSEKDGNSADEDLSLPASILGKEANVKSKANSAASQDQSELEEA